MQLNTSSSVCILGSSLSAIDAAVSLADSGHKGKIVMVSRNGRLPSVRGNQNLARTPMLLSRERMQDLVSKRSGQVSLLEIAQLIMKEVELTDGQTPDLAEIMRSGKGPHSYLDSEISDATVCDRAWQAILYSTNQSIDLIWHALSVNEKRLFQREFKSLWHSYRVSFPVQNALKIQQLLHSDQLTIYAGYKETFFDEACGRFVTKVSDQAKAFEAALYSDVVINATGYTNDVSKMRSSLLKAMQFNGLLSPNEFGGVNLDFETGRVVARSGAVMQGLYALGSLASGTYFWTNAMNVNTRLAAGVVKTILSDLSKIPGGHPNCVTTRPRLVPATLSPWGGELVFRGQQVAALSGENPHPNIVVIRFPSVAAVNGWFLSPAYQALIPLRQQAADVLLTSYEA